MRGMKTKEEFWNERMAVIKKWGGDCEVKNDYVVCRAPWWPFHWVVELIEAGPGDYGLRAIFCFGNPDDDPRCKE